jgi:hypothetical protein
MAAQIWSRDIQHHDTQNNGTQNYQINRDTEHKKALHKVP